MAAIARLAAVSLDTDDLPGLADFYRELLDLEVMLETDTFVALTGAAILLTVQKVDEHRAPDWPEGATPKQIHLELAVTDLDEAEGQAVAIGAVKAEAQPNVDVARVLFDPAGHPFCLTILIPEV
jgi:catechol 2,3-dioxygenase-like lactoylglutathione lyase family enzyme